MRKNDAFVAKIINTPLPKISVAIFAPRRNAAKFCHPGDNDYDE